MEIKPLSDWVVLKQHEHKHKTFFIAGASTHRGTVVAVGPGKPIKRFIEVTDPLNGKKFKTRAGAETRYRKPMDLVPGDVVEYSDAGWEERYINNEPYIFTRQDSVICFADTTDTEGFQEHRSAIID